MRAFLAIALFAALAPPCRTEVADVAADHFAVTHEADLNVSGQRAWTALVDEIDQWWDPSHTFGGDAAALRLEAKPGGCFCETLPEGGGVVHLTVINAAPGKTLVLTGALGPLQQHPVQGVMTWQLEPANGKTHVKLTYRVSGWFQSASLADLAPAVDGVLGEQLARYAEHVNR
jgi:hypothetical protein